MSVMKICSWQGFIEGEIRLPLGIPVLTVEPKLPAMQLLVMKLSTNLQILISTPSESITLYITSGLTLFDAPSMFKKANDLKRALYKVDSISKSFQSFMQKG